MSELPSQVHRTSALWWDMVGGLMKNDFPENQAYNIVNEFFQNFKPIPRDKVQRSEGTQ